MENYEFNKGAFIWGIVGGIVISNFTRGNPRAFVSCGLGYTLVLTLLAAERKNPKD